MKESLLLHRVVKYTAWLIAYLPLWHLIYFGGWDAFAHGKGGDSFKTILQVSILFGLPFWILSVIPAPWSIIRKCYAPFIYILLYLVQFIPHVVVFFLGGLTSFTS